jgi:hypothetical protein
MKHLLATLVASIIILLSFSASAQFGYGRVSEIQELSNRKLLVVLEEPREKTIKKLDKKNNTAQKEFYLSNITRFNRYITETTQKFWTFPNKGLSYVTLAQADSLKKLHSKDYAVLYCAPSRVSNFSSGFVDDDRMDLIWNAEDEDHNRSYLDKYFVCMKIALLEDLYSKPIWYTTLMDAFPTCVSLISGMRSLQQYMDVRIRKKVNDEKVREKDLMNDMIKTHKPLLSKKTLLIREDLIGKKADKEELKNAYPYKMEFVNGARLDSLAMSGSPDYVYAMVLPAVNSGVRENEVFFFQAILGCSDNAVYAMSQPNVMANALTKTLSFGFASAGHGSKFINAKTLKDFIDN